MADVKNYVYISDTKVDLFYEQIASSDKQKLSYEYGVDLKIVKALVKTEKEKNLTRIDKLNRVIQFLNGSNKLGRMPNPLEYVAGTMDLKWGSLGDEAVAFMGRASRNFIFLAGSLNHVVGAANAPKGKVFPSHLPFMLDIIYAYERDHIDPIPTNLAVRSGLEQSDLEWAMSVIQSFKGPFQKFFLAKTHLYGAANEGGDGDLYVLMGSPFYVAVSE